MASAVGPVWVRNVKEAMEGPAVMSMVQAIDPFGRSAISSEELRSNTASPNGDLGAKNEGSTRKSLQAILRLDDDDPVDFS